MIPDRRVACAWCGDALDSSQARDGIAWCAACGTGTTCPWPSESELDAAYAGWYRPPGGRFGKGDAVLRRTRGRLAVRIDRLAPPGPVLDVGAGDGTLLDALAARGREAVGLERVATRPDLDTRDLDEIEGEWASVVMWHSLEHRREPRADLERVARLLAPGGYLFLAAPNIDSLQARVFGSRWLGLDLPRHLVHLPARRLLAGLSAAGLEVQRVSHLRGGQVTFCWLHGLVRMLPGRPSLYDAIRTPEARSRPMSRAKRSLALSAGALLAPVALALAGLEALLRRGGTVYVEARRP